MPFDSLLKGLIIGFSLAAPIGPIGILCAKGTVLNGIRRGFVIGISGACGDIVYAIVAAFGVKFVIDLVVFEQYWMRLLGGIILIGAGVFTFRSRPKATVEPRWKFGETRIFISIFFLDIVNPLTLFGFAAAFSAIGVNKLMQERFSGVTLIGGVFLGSLIWFSLLTWLAHIFKEKITTHGFDLVNKFAGGALVLFGVAGICYGLRLL